jgi:hypothetical protein
MVVEQALHRLDINDYKVTLGEVEAGNAITKEKLIQFKKNLAALGFELLDDSKTRLNRKNKKHNHTIRSR